MAVAKDGRSQVSTFVQESVRTYHDSEKLKNIENNPTRREFHWCTFKRLQFWGRKTEKGSWNCQKAFYRYTQVDAVILISYHDNINIWYVLTRKQYRSHTSSARHMTVFGWASSRGKEIPQDSESHKWEFHAQNFTMQGHVGKTFPRSQYTLKVLDIWYQKQLFEMLMDGPHKKRLKSTRCK